LSGKHAAICILSTFNIYVEHRECLFVFTDLASAAEVNHATHMFYRSNLIGLCLNVLVARIAHRYCCFSWYCCYCYCQCHCHRRGRLQRHL